MQRILVLALVGVMCLLSASARSDDTAVFLGAGYAAPERLTGSLDVARVVVPDPHGGPALFLTSHASAGVGGGRAALGFGLIPVPLSQSLGYAGLGSALALRVSVDRTWGSPAGVPAHTTLVGPELEYYFVGLAARVALLQHVSGPSSGSTTFVWGVRIAVPVNGWN